MWCLLIPEPGLEPLQQFHPRASAQVQLLLSVATSIFVKVTFLFSPGLLPWEVFPSVMLSSTPKKNEQPPHHVPILSGKTGPMTEPSAKTADSSTTTGFSVYLLLSDCPFKVECVILQLSNGIRHASL